MHEWLDALRSYGIVVSRVVLTDKFPKGPKEIEKERIESLRTYYREFETGIRTIDEWLWAVTNILMGIENRPLLAFREEALKYLGGNETLKGLTPPDAILLSFSEVNVDLVPRLCIWLVEKERKTKLPWTRACAEAHRFLRSFQNGKIRLGLVTDGFRFRLYHVDIEGEAWIEWDASRWFEESAHLDEMSGFALLLNKEMLGIGKTGEPLIESLVRESRKRQGDISAQLGERLRCAVEMMINRVVNPATQRSATQEGTKKPLDIVAESPSGTRLSEEDTLMAIYQAAIRTVMRLVFISYAESRSLLPMDAQTYVTGYSIQHLYDTLERNKRNFGDEYLRKEAWAWPRIISLFRLIYSGCNHPDLRLPQYGGELFAPSSMSSEDSVLRAMALFEDPLALTDFDTLQLLSYIRRGGLKKNGEIEAGGEALDFAQLRTEYIGIMYEGFLDYFPKLVHPEDVAYVELKGKGFNAYPLKRLEDLAEDKEKLKEFIKKIREGSRRDEAEEEIDEVEEELEEVQDEDEAVESYEESDTSSVLISGNPEIDQRVRAWALKAAVASGMLRKKKPSPEEEQEAISSLIKKDGIHPPDKIFLISWKGVRKGSGTYYTRPGLVIPLVERTLRPLVLNADSNELKRPEEILKLKIVDPAMGSGSFLVAAANFLTDELLRSWKYHGLIEKLACGERLLFPDGRPATGLEEEDIVALSPNDERFDEYMRVRLKRHVIERCIYGVDINPLAVELAKLSLWLETMDPRLPFEFLDHKLKCGNSLVGAWLFETFDYPIAAWKRYENIKDDETDPLKKVVKKSNDWIKQAGEICREELMRWEIGFMIKSLEGVDPYALSRAVKEKFEKIHRAIEKDRPRLYENFIQSDEYKKLKRVMDRWCAVWFWPPDEEFHENKVPKPSWFYERWSDDSGFLGSTAEIVANEMKFFHWEIEFPDVFIRENPGFDAVLGNPPWNRIKPESPPFFTRYDPLFPTYGKQAAIQVVEDLFSRYGSIKEEWQSFYLEIKSTTYWAKNCCLPFTIPKGKNRAIWEVHINERLRNEEPWYGGNESFRAFRPFALQGTGDVNLYKLFIEQAMYLVRKKGRVGMVLPGAIHMDEGSKYLRKAFLEDYGWEWLYSFENKKRIFPIDTRYIFALIVLQEGKKSEKFRTAFYLHDLEEWENLEHQGATMNHELVNKFSPHSLLPRAINKNDEIKILDKIYSKSRLIGDQNRSPRIRYCSEFHMTNDSKLFPSRDKWEKKGFVRDPFGFWVNKDGYVGLPLIEGKMIYQFDPVFASHLGGNEWEWMDWHLKCPMPRYIMSREDYCKEKKSIRGSKITIRDITNSTNERTAISCVVWDFPRGHSVAGFCSDNPFDFIEYPLYAYLNSFVLDFNARTLNSGVHMSKYILDELSVDENCIRLKPFNLASATLSLPLPLYSSEWLIIKSLFELGGNWTDYWSWSELSRMRYRAIIDAIAFYGVGIDLDDVKFILSLDEKDPRGFHRIDKDLFKEHRYPTIVVNAFSDLVNEFNGNIEKFSDFWTLPDDAILHRDSIRGMDWRKWNPDERLSPEADRLAAQKGVPWMDFKDETDPRIADNEPDVPRYAIHVHRDRLANFIRHIKNNDFAGHIVEVYDRLWDEVWAKDPYKTSLTWRDCDEYARCVLSFVRPEGAYDRLREVLSGTKPYRYIYDPEFEERIKEWNEGNRKSRKKSKSGSKQKPLASLEDYME